MNRRESEPTFFFTRRFFARSFAPRSFARMTSHGLRIAVILATSVAAVPMALSGCASDPSMGYAATSPFPTRYRSVALPIFRNQSFLRGFEFDLAHALVTEVEQSTPYKVTSEASADTALRGTITSIDLVQLSKDPGTGLANEMMVRVRADFEWVDLRTGNRIVAREGVESSAVFVPSYPAREPIELGRLSAVQSLARDLVGAMRSNW
jgi:hypothetical protein